VDAIISHGCFLRECTIQHSIVGERSRLDYGVELQVNCHIYRLAIPNIYVRTATLVEKKKADM